VTREIPGVQTLSRAATLVALLTLTILPASAQADIRNAPPNQAPFSGRNIQAKVLMPVSLTALAVKTIHVKTFIISNLTASAATFTIQDGDGASYGLAKDVTIAANSFYVVPMADGGGEFKDGLYVSSSSGTLVARVKGWTDEF